MAMLEAVHDSASPTHRPMPKVMPQADVAVSANASPKAYTVTPKSATGRAPCRSAKMPMKGWVMPQTMFWMAMASEKSAAVMPISRIMCGCSKPKLWRMPMAKLSITAAPPKIRATWNRDRSVCFMLRIIFKACRLDRI